MDDERDTTTGTSSNGSGAARPRAIEPMSESDDALKAAIEEAVQAVEKVNERRKHDDEAGGGETSVSGDEVETLKREVETLRDQSLRTLADFDNYRKRIERERREEKKYAAVEVLRELVGIVDNLERALTADGSLDDLKQGVELILRQMEDALRRSGVERIEAAGKEFDPTFHEAVSRVEDPEAEEPHVVEEFQTGYLVHDRLLRPSIVKVAVPSAEGGSAEVAGSEEATD